MTSRVRITAKECAEKFLDDETNPYCRNVRVKELCKLLTDEELQLYALPMNCVTIKVQKSLAHYLNIVGYFFHSTCPVYRATARYAMFLKFENNIEGRARLWDTALKFLSPIPRVTSPDHLEGALPCSDHFDGLQSRTQSPQAFWSAGGRDTLGYWNFSYRRISAVKQCKPLRGSQSKKN